MDREKTKESIQKTTSHSKDSIDRNQLSFKTDDFEKEVKDLIEKYSGMKADSNLTEYKTNHVDKGFYLIFVKRDETIDPRQRLQITEFASAIGLPDLTAALADVIENHLQGLSYNKIRYDA